MGTTTINIPSPIAHAIRFRPQTADRPDVTVDRTDITADNDH